MVAAPWSDMIVADGHGGFFRREVIPERGRCVMDMWRVPFGVPQKSAKEEQDEMREWFRRVFDARVTITKDAHVVAIERREDEMADYARAQWDTDHRLTKPHKEERIGY